MISTTNKKDDSAISGLLGNLTRPRQSEKVIPNALEKGVFTIEAGSYVCAKVNSVPDSGEHFMVSKDNTEITVVTREENVKYLDLLEIGKERYGIILPASASSSRTSDFLAAISSALSGAGLDFLILSTYSKDYLLVKVSLLGQARQALLSLGMTEMPSRKG